MNLRQLLPATGKKALATAEGDELPLAVLEFQSPTAAVIATPLPNAARHTSYVVTLLVLVTALLAGFMKVEQLVVGTGVLNAATPDSSIEIFNSSSIIRDIKVHAGEFVTKGQVLATLDPTYTQADVTALTQQAQNYGAQVAQLQAQEAGKPYIPDPNNPYSALQMQTYSQQMGQYNSTIQNYDQQIAQLQTQINGFEQQAAYYRQRLGIAANVETMREKLQQLQVGSELDTEAATDTRVSMQSQLDAAVSQAQADRSQLAATQAQRDSFAQQFKAQTSTSLATALNDLAQAQQSLSKANLDNQLIVLTAPQDSIVQSIASVSVGSVLQAGQQLMDLAPINTPFTAEADIDSSESGYVQPGQKVTIKFSTLDSMLHGSAHGTVLSVSPESFNPADQQAQLVNGAPLPGAPQDLYFKVEISLDEMNMFNVPAGFRLVPGMPIEADITVGKQSILAYFFARMASIAYNSMHEP